MELFTGSVRRICAQALTTGVLCIGLVGAATAQQLDVAEAENLVRSVYFESFPEDDARRIGADGAARLIEMLDDATESGAHANILLALGLCGQPRSLEAIRDWARTARSGEISRDTFRAWQALPFAIGYLVDHNAKAVALLEERLKAAPPNWTFRHHRTNRLRAQARKGAATALGMSRHPAARRELHRALKRTRNPEFRDVLTHAQSISSEVRR